MRDLRVIDAGLVPYTAAYCWQSQLHEARTRGEVGDTLLLLEHPHVYTLGRRFSPEHLLVSADYLKRAGIEVVEADRGGSITYHGPGQLVGYPIMDLRKPANPHEAPDPLRYLRMLEQVLIVALRSMGIVAGRRDGLTGVWVGTAKIASIGVNISRGVSKHGFALNVDPDLSFFEGMVPCGIDRVEMTSVASLIGEGDVSLAKSFLARHTASVFHRRLVPGVLSDVGIGEADGEGAGARIRPQAEVIQFPSTSSG